MGDEPPKVFQASAQTRTAPGGVSSPEMQQKGGMLLSDSEFIYTKPQFPSGSYYWRQLLL